MVLRQTEAELAEIYRFARREHGAYAAVEVLDETAVVFEHYRRFQTGAREQVRNLDRPPYFWDEEELAGQEKLQIERMAADRIGLLPMETLIEGNADSLVTLLIHASGLLTALSNVFESLWRLAVPVTTEGIRRPIDERDREILTLMAGGATDDAIARHLGMSRRTVVRRAASLLERLGATTRFQAGVQASRRGWL